MLENKLSHKFVKVPQSADIMATNNLKIVLDFLDAIVNDSNLYEVQKYLILKLTYAIRCVVDNNFQGIVEMRKEAITIKIKED